VPIITRLCTGPVEIQVFKKGSEVIRSSRKTARLVPLSRRRSEVARKTLKRKTTTELVVDELRSRIISGEIAEGQPLLQEHLANDLGVSRIPLREALRQLESEGLVTLTSHRGGVVSRLSEDEVRELFEIRSCLETWLLTLAIPKMTPVEIAALDEVIERMRPGEISHWGELNWQFHEALYAPARRKQTIALLRRIHHNLDRYLRLQISVTSGWQKANFEHRTIVEYCRRKDVRRATACLDAHIMDASAELIETLSKRRAKHK
jgi:DNA-binding GntR family transcriptional regulator